MTDLPNDLQNLRNPLPGETPGQHIARCIKAFIGVSLSQNRDKLNELFLVNEPNAATATQIAGYQTNCGTFVREIWCLAGCPDHFVTQPYEVGMAVTWDLEAAQEMGSLIDCRANPNAWKDIDEGYGLHYGTPGFNNDHMEFALGKPDPNTGVCFHAGGGRSMNLISSGTDDIRYSLGRPLLAIIKPEKMATAGDPVLPPVVVVPDPTPTPEPTVDPVGQLTVPNSNNIASSNLFVIIMQWLMALINKLFGK